MLFSIKIVLFLRKGAKKSQLPAARLLVNGIHDASDDFVVESVLVRPEDAFFQDFRISFFL